MPADYKPKARKKRRRKSRSSSAWILPVAALGAAGAGLGVYFYYNHIHHFPAPATTADQEAAAQARPVSRPHPEHSGPDYDFYTMLPEMEVEISDEGLEKAIRSQPKPEESGPYILQAGSFRRYEEADNLKARLALLGVEAKIQTVVISDDNTWYRVRVGPYDTLKDLKPVRTRLQHNGIEFVLLRIGA